MQNKTQVVAGSASGQDGDNDTAKKRAQLLDKIRSDSNLPAIGAAVSKVVQVASASDEAVRNLAQLILSDVALTQKVLRVANAACFRVHSGTPITTVSKAIFLLGFETVKTTALAMMLVDGMAGSRGKNVRGELVHALAASMMGRELAKRSQFRDAEEAAVAALFKNIGRLLLAAHDHASYAEINEQIAHGTAPSLAEMRVVGCSLGALGTEVLQEWQIPETIVSALDPLPGGALKTAKTRQEWIQQVAAFSHAAAGDADIDQQCQLGATAGAQGRLCTARSDQECSAGSGAGE
ncbi:MAG: hypothetical protein K0S28_601 [Paucimonas sp.]|nr:hypothetical protein [Paucimonas sp.]